MEQTPKPGHYDTVSAVWEVVAGAIPNEPMPELTKQYVYTSSMRAEDEKNLEGWHKGYQPHFAKQHAMAYMYALQLTDPRYVNWVRVDFIWM